jgi:hypothetical protein
MKHAGFLLGAILLFAIGSFAQDDSANPRPLSAPSGPGKIDLSSSFAPSKPPLFASAAAPGSAELPESPAPVSSSSSEPPAQRTSVYKVFETYNWEFYAGYAFFRFYALPNQTETMNGINLSISYYPTSSWFGVDGDVFGESGTFLHQTSHFTDYLGGVRVRRLGPHNLKLWAHGLVGYSKFLPQTAQGGQTAFSYEAGGGVDLGVPRRRLAYRVQADMVGTKFFHTYQLSPKISVGIVFKF